MIRILHLSDVHFGASHAYPYTKHDPASHKLADAVRSALEANNALPLDAVIISGDLLDADQVKDTVYAEENINELLKKLNLTPDRLLCVPGNHDLTWDKTFLDNRLHAKFRFYDSLMERVGSKDSMRSGLPHIRIIGETTDTPLAIALLSSCELESESMAGFGRVGEVQLDELAKEVNRLGISRESHIMAAVLHHHVVPIHPVSELWDPLNPEGSEPKRVSVTMDAALVMRRLAAMGFTRVLHGHQHGAARITYAVAEPGRFSIDILAAGSAGATVPNGGRHFFVHEIQGASFRTHSFTQSPENPKSFVRSSEEDDLVEATCAHDALVRSGRGASTTISVTDSRDEPPDEDTSDLNYVFLSVVDCPEARKAFKEALRGGGYDSTWASLNYFRLNGMYDLLGRWDLVIRFRASPVTVHSKKSLLEPLRRAGMIHSEGSDVGEDFVHQEWVDVLKEWHFDSWLDGGTQGHKPIRHMRLGEPKAYDDCRCQRGFIFVRKPRGTRGLEQRLREELRKYPRITPIIESVAVGEQAIVFEIFMICSQSSHVNRLNQAIEPALAAFKAQKFTLLCYGYDEEFIGREGQAAASGLLESEGT